MRARLGVSAFVKLGQAKCLVEILISKRKVAANQIRLADFYQAERRTILHSVGARQLHCLLRILLCLCRIAGQDKSVAQLLERPDSLVVVLQTGRALERLSERGFGFRNLSLLLKKIAALKKH